MHAKTQLAVLDAVIEHEESLQGGRPNVEGDSGTGDMLTEFASQKVRGGCQKPTPKPPPTITKPNSCFPRRTPRLKPNRLIRSAEFAGTFSTTNPRCRRDLWVCYGCHPVTNQILTLSPPSSISALASPSVLPVELPAHLPHTVSEQVCPVPANPEQLRRMPNTDG